MKYWYAGMRLDRKVLVWRCDVASSGNSLYFFEEEDLFISISDMFYYRI